MRISSSHLQGRHIILLLNVKQRKLSPLRKGEPIVMIDIAVPRDIDPAVADMEGIYLFNIDSLESVVEENKAQREEEARRAEPIIHDAIEELLDKLSYLTVRPMMALLTEKQNAFAVVSYIAHWRNCLIFPIRSVVLWTRWVA